MNKYNTIDDIQVINLPKRITKCSKMLSSLLG